MLDVRPGHPATVTIRRGNTETVMHLDVKTVAGTTANPAPVNPDDEVWRLLGMRTLPVSTEYVASVSPKLRGGLYVQAVSPGSPAAQASIQKGDILVGMNVGTRHWETIRTDNILYVLRQPETAQTQSALLYVVRRNGIQPRRISLGDITRAADLEPVTRPGAEPPSRISVPSILGPRRHPVRSFPRPALPIEGRASTSAAEPASLFECAGEQMQTW